MATWTDIPDEVLEPGKPIRSVDALALRDNAHPYEQLFTASGTFVSPKTGPVWLDVVGGGGRGGKAVSTHSGGGGGAGVMVSTIVNLTAGTSYPVVVGASQGASSVAGISAAAGGNGGNASSSVHGIGGVGGGGVGGGYRGGSGGNGYFGTVVAANGGGDYPGRGGRGYGAGGGGGSSNSNGGAGAPGVVRIRW